MTTERLPPGRHRGPPLERLQLPAPRPPADDTFTTHRADRPANLLPLPPTGTGAHRAPPTVDPDRPEWEAWLAEHYPWFVWPFLACCCGFFIGIIIFTVNGAPAPVPDLPTRDHPRVHTRGLPPGPGISNPYIVNGGYTPVHEPNVTRPPLPAATLHPDAWHQQTHGPFTEHHLTGRRTASTSYTPALLRSST